MSKCWQVNELMAGNITQLGSTGEVFCRQPALGLLDKAYAKICTIAAGRSKFSTTGHHRSLVEGPDYLRRLAKNSPRTTGGVRPFGNHFTAVQRRPRLRRPSRPNAVRRIFAMAHAVLEGTPPRPRSRRPVCAEHHADQYQRLQTCSLRHGGATSQSRLHHAHRNSLVQTNYSPPDRVGFVEKSAQSACATELGICPRLLKRFVDAGRQQSGRRHYR